MICEIEFVKQAVKLGKGVNELSFWWSCIYQKNEHMVIVYSLRKSRAGSDGALTVAVEPNIGASYTPKKDKDLKCRGRWNAAYNLRRTIHYSCF